RLRAVPPAREVRRYRARERSHSRAPAWKYVGPGLVEHLPAGRAAQFGACLRSDRAAPKEKHGLEADSPNRRGLLHLARLRAVARYVLGAIAFPAAERPGCGLPRERMGRRHG